MPIPFRRDLALVCRSHQTDDIDDFSLFNTDSHYGNEPDEKANVHYIAIILRTADLLHITKDRTPSIQYSLISPTDPKSIIEWQKQNAVTAIFPQKKRNKDSQIDETLQKDTVQIDAYFASEQADAYFGLSSYIEYARKQLKKSASSIIKSIKLQSTTGYIFPWCDIYENIETEGFDKNKLQFDLDKENILNLLVGNTLYNDSSVTLRELIQNGIDAISLQKLIDKNEKKSLTNGEIQVKWNHHSRILSISDNGTGMDCYDIENYLLKVGSSKYRSEDFKKKYPNFCAISRFGIGVLTCFMIADDIDIITNSQAECTANRITIKKVSGKYLLKKIHKTSLNALIKHHGTEFILKVRTDVDMNDITGLMKKWIILPPYPVNLTIDESAPISIGFSSPEEALQTFLTEHNIAVSSDNFRVKSESVDGVTLAYAVAYSSYLKEWSFLTADTILEDARDVYTPIGTCIGGIRVETSTPGFSGIGIIALANMEGSGSTQTNVARSAIESNAGKNNFLSSVYKIYVKHIQSEVDRIIEAGYSSVWASNEAQYLVEPLISRRSRTDEISDYSLLMEELNSLRCIILEKDGVRRAESPQFINSLDSVGVIDSAFVKGAEALLREVKTDKTLKDITNYLGVSIGIEENQNFLCNINSNFMLHENALNLKQVTSIKISREHRRINIIFENNDSLWDSYKILPMRHYDFTNASTVFIPKSNSIICEDLLDSEVGVIAFTGVYISPHTEFYKRISHVRDVLLSSDKKEEMFAFRAVLRLITSNTSLRAHQGRQIEGSIFEQEEESAFDPPPEKYAIEKLVFLA